MLVTTTAIYGEELDRIKKDLHQQGVTYVAELTTSTNVLIAGRSEGGKCRVARERGIPCVTPAWVRLGRCFISRIGEFEMGRSLLGLEVCSTSLSIDEVGFVRRACETHRAKYNAFLTRRCAVLVVPNGKFVEDQSEKLHFARENRIDFLPYDKFMKRYCFATELQRNLAPVSRQQPLGNGIQGLVVYCTPESLMTETISSLFEKVGVQRVPVLTPLTTHVLVLEPTNEVFPQRPNLEFVSVAWLEECAKQQKQVAVESYRVSVFQLPVITFTGVPREERMAILSCLEERGLSCLMQEDFVLGRMADDSSGQRNTTHLVTGRSALLQSSKVAALSCRVYKLRRKECFLVDVEWLRRSLEVGSWVELTQFSLEVPPISAFGWATKRTRKTLAAATAPDINNHMAEDYDNKRGLSSPCFLAREKGDEMLPSRSLELLIEELESKTSGRGSASTTPIIAVSQSVWPKKSSFQERTEDHSCKGAHLERSTAPLSLEPNRTSVPVESQVIVYKRSELELPKKLMRQQQQHSVLPCTEKTGGDADGFLLTEGAVYKIEESPRRPSGRFCCIMISKALMHMEENLERLQALGCTLAKTVEECTHYVTGKPSRTEFFLCSVAAGKWVLAPSFLEETLREGRIVPEEAHEWCPEIAIAALLRNSVVDLVRACSLQRKRTVRSFSSWRVALCCATESRTESFSRVLRSGGCRVIRPYSPPQILNTLKSDFEELRDLCFVLSDDNVWEASQLDTLAVHLPVLRMEYVAHCLCVEVPEPDLYLVQGDSGRLRKRLKVV
ncbi:hypothetical protein C3747_357g24 [Trypanosoma cruzi]|uniref:BRCT domain-containing protein n=1 Tax=Trypanosoma cruzi TaxID=5693 RepID=A0A2V2V8N4_TRYCR|nr:hypothetical protein C3747_357g24 [Trypanosoma cruzi]